MFHLALTKAGVDAQLLVYEALPHAFWYHYDLPETTDHPEAHGQILFRQIGEITRKETQNWKRKNRNRNAKTCVTPRKRMATAKVGSFFP